ncbi:MAG: MFS transporter, partial [Pseudomonadota bacterium]
RFIGILLSGALYQVGGMTACLIGSAALLTLCWAFTLLLPSEVMASSADREPEQPLPSGSAQ